MSNTSVFTLNRVRLFKICIPNAQYRLYANGRQRLPVRVYISVQTRNNDRELWRERELYQSEIDSLTLTNHIGEALPSGWEIHRIQGPFNPATEMSSETGQKKNEAFFVNAVDRCSALTESSQSFDLFLSGGTMVAGATVAARITFNLMGTFRSNQLIGSINFTSSIFIQTTQEPAQIDPNHMTLHTRQIFHYAHGKNNYR